MTAGVAGTRAARPERPPQPAQSAPPPWEDAETLLELGDGIVAQARSGEQVEAVLVHSVDTEVRAWDGEVESFSSAASFGAGVRVVVDDRQGFAYAGTWDPDVVAETFAAARANAAFGTPDEYQGVATPDGVEPTCLDLFRGELAEVPPEKKIDLALELERAVKGADKRIAGVETAEYVDSLSAAAVVNTSGIRAFGRHSTCFLMAYAMASDGGDTQTGFGYSVGRSLQDLDLKKAAGETAERALRLLGAGKPATGRTTVVFDPWVTAQFLGVVGGTLSGEALLKGRSLFADRVGEGVAAEIFSLRDDPTNPLAFGASEADGEGLATRRNDLIVNGELKKFLHNTYTARRLGAASTASAVRSYASTPGVGCAALIPSTGSKTPEELIAGIDDGVLVQDLAGLHSGVNPVSGDFSTGADGLRIRNGALAEPIREFTLASTIQRMLLDISGVGDDLSWLPSGAAGVTLVVDGVMLSGE